MGNSLFELTKDRESHHTSIMVVNDHVEIISSDSFSYEYQHKFSYFVEQSFIGGPKFKRVSLELENFMLERIDETVLIFLWDLDWLSTVGV